jgi:hypothetical protein
MKKMLLLLAVIVLGLFLTGCFAPTVPSDKDIEVKVISFEQDVSLVGAKDVKALKVFNGEDLKCGPYCPPCDCDSCCDCEECEQCEECEECEQCEQCEECPECPECPSCPSCPCYQIKWGDLVVYYEMNNIGNVDSTVDRVCFIIRFDDGTEIERCVDMEVAVLVGENIEKEVGIVLPNPVKRVTFVEVKSEEFH